MTEVTSIKWKNLEGLQMENAFLRVVILPRLGGKLASVCYKDKSFELAAQSGASDYALPEIDADFSQYDASGIDDAFPNIVKAKVRRQNRELCYPDHGEIWSSPLKSRIAKEAVYLTYSSSRFQYQYEKCISLKENMVCIQYEIKNLSDDPFPCLWAFHGLVRYEEDMELLYSKDVESFENVLLSPKLGEAGRHVPLDNQEYDFSRVPVKASGTMVKYYADKKLTHGFCGYRYPGQGMECLLTYSARKLPYLGVWITAGGFRGDYNCAMEPATGYYDDIRIAEKNESLYWLKKEKPLRFTLTMTIRELENKKHTGGISWKQKEYPSGKKIS